MVEILVWLQGRSNQIQAVLILAIMIMSRGIIISTKISVLVESENIIKYLDETFGQCALTKQADKFKTELPNTPDDIVNFFMEKVMEPWYQVVYYNLRTVPKSLFKLIFMVSARLRNTKSDKSELFLSSLNQLDKMIGGIKDRKFLEGDESPGIADFNIWVSPSQTQTVPQLTF